MCPGASLTGTGVGVKEQRRGQLALVCKGAHQIYSIYMRLPIDIATALYYTGNDPFTKKPVMLPRACRTG